MSCHYNHTTLVGRLAHDPQLRHFNNSVTKTTFSLAVDRDYRREDGTVDTDFIPICLWGKAAEIGHALLRKGMPVLVWGRIQIRSYEKENQKRRITEIVGDSFQILEKKRKDSVPEPTTTTK